MGNADVKKSADMLISFYRKSDINKKDRRLHMYDHGFEMKKWRSEMVNSYKNYLSKIEPTSEEYKRICEGVATLEKIPL
jgi:hypothetical protein